MLPTTRKKASTIGAVVGGLAATAGQVNISSPSLILIIDVALGAAIWYGVVYGVCTLVIKFKK